jgi:hypothetical protein
MELLEFAIFYTSLTVNTVLVILSVWGMIAFFPHRVLREDSPASWLILAIWLGFLAVGMHTMYWRVAGDIAHRFEFLTIEEVTWFGKNVVDFVWNSVAIVSIYLHFYARYKSISKEEQRMWSPLLMGFYPDLSHWAVKTSSKIQSLYRR